MCIWMVTIPHIMKVVVLNNGKANSTKNQKDHEENYNYSAKIKG